MKKLLFIIGLLLLGAALYAGVEQIQIKLISIKSATRYYGSDITKYDLGDTECFVVGAGNKAISCLRK